MPLIDAKPNMPTAYLEYKITEKHLDEIQLSSETEEWLKDFPQLKRLSKRVLVVFDFLFYLDNILPEIEPPWHYYNDLLKCIDLDYSEEISGKHADLFLEVLNQIQTLYSYYAHQDLFASKHGLAHMKMHIWIFKENFFKVGFPFFKITEKFPKMWNDAIDNYNKEKCIEVFRQTSESKKKIEETLK